MQQVLRKLAAWLSLPFLLAATLAAAESDKSPAETGKPSLTYYYFDG